LQACESGIANSICSGSGWIRMNKSVNFIVGFFLDAW